MADHPLHGPVLRWYAEHRRDLPWRRPDCTPWGIMVSEVMLQQTPVNRVLPAWHAWLDRWPEPAALAAEPAGEAIRMWDRLGYPRRALRLHASAREIVARHGGRVPESLDALLALPGIGTYTAAAIASFAFEQRHPVVDTNVRRVLARTVSGQAYPDDPPTAAQARLAAELVPDAPERAALWAAASMELGALICSARSPRCSDCPVADLCRWRLSGRPAHTGPPRRGQSYQGTDRYVRGLLLAVLRRAATPVDAQALRDAAPDPMLRDPLQRDRCLAALIEDGLVDVTDAGRYTLPAG